VSAGSRKLRIDLCYDGTDFAGWQIQPGLRTVQGVLEERLGRLAGGRPIRVSGAGRTDAGVHARGQVAVAEGPFALDDAALAYRLRRLLPPDVRPLRVATAGSDFDARRSARSKTYVYRLDLSTSGSPFERRFALHVPRGFDASRVERAVERLVGRHDWSGFTASGCTIEDRVRTMTEARLEPCAPGLVRFVFTADGFLTHMARNLAGTLLEIARGRLGPERVSEVLRSRCRELAGPTAPARGLWLERVEY
jgi:tRNA pseudouridine38-40 synthase